MIALIIDAIAAAVQTSLMGLSVLIGSAPWRYGKKMNMKNDDPAEGDGWRPGVPGFPEQEPSREHSAECAIN
jgi:hypothetical protein